MKKGTKIVCIIGAAILAYIIILIGIPYDKEDLTIVYYCAMAIVKAILVAACILSVSILSKNENKK